MVSTLYNEGMKRNELVEYLDEFLDLVSFSSFDPSLNGLVFGGDDKEVKKIAFAVDACQRTFELASDGGADLLVVHHGLFWGHPISVTGAHYKRIKTLFTADLNVYAAHLPLDAHPSVGNNAVMAKLLKLEQVQGFAPFKGRDLGCKGILPQAMRAEGISSVLGFSHPVILPFGKELIQSVGIVSGGASDDVYAALKDGLDCFITGECEHQVYNDCQEQGITMIAGGHYESEVFGVQALGAHLKERFGLETFFVANPTGL